jgi:hypothetical protein
MDAINQVDLIYIYRTSHPNTKEYTHSSLYLMRLSLKLIIHSEQSKSQQIKNIELTHFILSGHHGLKMDINNKRNNRKLTKSLKTKQLSTEKNVSKQK